MVMIPNGACILLVGKVVVLVLPWLSDVFSPAVKGCTRIGAMEMDRVGSICSVDEPHDRLSSPGQDEGGTWRYAVVPRETGGLKTWIDRVVESFNLHFAVLDFFGVVGIGDDSVMA